MLLLFGVFPTREFPHFVGCTMARRGAGRETHRGSELLGPLLLSRLELVGGRVGSVSQPGVGHLVSDCKGWQGDSIRIRGGDVMGDRAEEETRVQHPRAAPQGASKKRTHRRGSSSSCSSRGRNRCRRAWRGRWGRNPRACSCWRCIGGWRGTPRS
jgi:hypothetical protein